MTTPAMPELPEPEGFMDQTLGGEPAFTADQMRARDAMWMERLAALQSAQPAAAVPMTENQRADMACAVAAICTGASSRTVADTAIEWTERFYGITAQGAQEGV